MQTIKYNLSELSKAIKTEIEACDIGPFALSKRSKVDYFAIRRFKNNAIKKVTDNVRDICKDLGINIDEFANTDTTLKELQAIVQDVWDGTPAHAELLKQLLKSTKAFRVKSR